MGQKAKVYFSPYPDTKCLKLTQLFNLTDLVQTKNVQIQSAEERCGHLVRLGEQRHQEIRTLEAQLTGIQDSAKQMILSQGAEISRASVAITHLASILGSLTGVSVNEEPTSISNNGDEINQIINLPKINGDTVVDESLQSLSNAISLRKKIRGEFGI